MPSPDTADTLFPIVYEAPKRIARHQLTAAGDSALSTRLTEHEIAGLLGSSARMIEGDWLKARLFLLRYLDVRAAAAIS
jgi:hypothetical protein